MFTFTASLTAETVVAGAAVLLGTAFLMVAVTVYILLKIKS